MEGTIVFHTSASCLLRRCAFFKFLSQFQGNYDEGFGEEQYTKKWPNTTNKLPASTKSDAPGTDGTPPVTQAQVSDAQVSPLQTDTPPQSVPASTENPTDSEVPANTKIQPQNEQLKEQPKTEPPKEQPKIEQPNEQLKTEEQPKIEQLTTESQSQLQNEQQKVQAVPRLQPQECEKIPLKTEEIRQPISAEPLDTVLVPDVSQKHDKEDSQSQKTEHKKRHIKKALNSFGKEVGELVERLSLIVSDSAKLLRYKSDPEMKADLYHRIGLFTAFRDLLII